MENKTTNMLEENKETQIKACQSVGQTLKACRVENKLKVEQIASQLNLPKHTIEQIENDNYEDLPELAYVRGYIVSYCRLLKLDSDEILKNFEYEDVNQLKVGQPTGILMPQYNISKITPVFLKVLIVLCIVGLVAWISTQSNKSEVVTYSTPLAEQQVNTTVNTTTLESPDLTTTNVTNFPVSSEPNDAGQANTNTVLSDEETGVASNVVSAENKNLLELEFNTISWVDIQDSTKKKIVYKSFPRGEVHTVTVNLPLNIFIDNAEGVLMRYEGKLIDLESHTKEDGYAKFTLTE